MDRQISPKEKKKKQTKSLVKVGIVAAAAVVVVAALGRMLGDSIRLDDVKTGTADMGAIETTISTLGRLMPLSEENVVAPISSRILEVYKNPGDSVVEGEPLLKLDLSSVDSEYQQRLNEKEIRENQLLQLQIRLENAISSMLLKRQIDEMRLQQSQAELEREKFLDSIGASTGTNVRKVEVEYKQAVLEHELLLQDIANEQKRAAAELRVQELEFANFESNLATTERLLMDARIFSPRTATLTYINNQIGSQVSTGSNIATVSDLSRFKIDAEVSDLQAEKLRMGASALIRSGSEEYTGTVTNITPSATGGVVKFTITLDDTVGQRLRSGSNAEVFVRHGILDNVVRLPNSLIFGSGRGSYDVWVVEGNKAVKRSVTIGESSYEYVEVTAGLQPGETVILSDMTRYIKKETIRIKK